MICEKVTYETRNLARDAAKRIAQRNNDSMDYYKCNECGHFHIRTARNKGNLQKKTVKHNSELYKEDGSINLKKTTVPNIPDTKQVGYATEKIFAHLFKRLTK